MSTKPDILQTQSVETQAVDLSWVNNAQADDAEDDDDGVVEDVGDSESDAEEDA